MLFREKEKILNILKISPVHNAIHGNISTVFWTQRNFSNITTDNIHIILEEIAFFGN